MPICRRPSLRMSSVARSWARRSGWYQGTIEQATPTLTRVVCAAIAASRLCGALIMPVLPTSLLDIEDVNRYTPSLSAWNLCRVHRMGAYRHDPTTHPTPRRGQTGSRRSEGPGGADAAWDLERVGSATPAGNPRGRGSGSGVSGVVESPQPSAPGVSQNEAQEADGQAMAAAPSALDERKHGLTSSRCCAKS